MERVSPELAILSKAVAFSNLSSAAGPVGLSQPQLSRIVARLENELQVVLLDRTAKRKSGWTPMAHRLAEIYSKSSRHLTEQIRRLAQESEPQSLRFGALDGLAMVAAELSTKVFKQTTVRSIELDLYDLIQLEESFLKGELDLIFSGREPGRKKFHHIVQVGYQSLDELGKAGDTQVMSPFEFGLQARAAQGRKPSSKIESERILISNSLWVRRHWIEVFGGRGIIPSPMRKAPGKGREEPVFLIGQDALSPRLWEKIASWVMVPA